MLSCSLLQRPERSRATPRPALRICRLDLTQPSFRLQWGHAVGTATLVGKGACGFPHVNARGTVAFDISILQRQGHCV